MVAPGAREQPAKCGCSHHSSRGKFNVHRTSHLRSHCVFVSLSIPRVSPSVILLMMTCCGRLVSAFALTFPKIFGLFLKSENFVPHKPDFLHSKSFLTLRSIFQERKGR